MTRYVEQLLEDIENAKKDADARLNALNSLSEADKYQIIIEVDRISCIKLSNLFERELMYFSEKKFLYNDEISALVNAIEDLWNAYGLNSIFPEDLPDTLKYCHFRNYLEQHVFR